MTLSRMLAAALVAAAVTTPTATARPALAGPAAADSHKQPDSWYAGKSSIEGSKHSGQQGERLGEGQRVCPAGRRAHSTPVASPQRLGEGQRVCPAERAADPTARPGRERSLLGP